MKIPMKPLLPRLRRIAGFTLVEMLVGAVATSILLGGLMTGSIAIQRSFAANEQLTRAQMDLLRVADYMTRDIRNSTSVNTTATESVLLTVTAGDYYDRRGTPANLADDVANSPVLGRTGATYGTSPVTIRYLKSGTRIAREVTRVDAGVSTTSTNWIADNVETLTVAVDATGKITFTSGTAMTYSRRKAGAQTFSQSLVMTSQSRNPQP